MASGFKKIGDWGKIDRTIKNLGTDINAGTKIALKQVGLKAEAIAVKHIKNQDLDWEKLEDSTLKIKEKKGHSNKTLVATTDYMNSITSYSDGKEAFAGVKKDVRNRDGDDMVNIALIHEFGNENIPKRPLWKPTFEETLEWMIDKKLFQNEVLNRIHKRK